MAETRYPGCCLCGAVRFSIAAPLPHFYQCHCSLCRRLSGSACDTACFVDLPQFRWEAGEDNIRSYQTASAYRSDFCLTCGSTVPHRMRNGRQAWVPAGLLDEAGDSEVRAHLFVASRASWDRIAEGACHHDAMPEMEELDLCLRKALTPSQP
ncbi:GFA family protein [Chromobacterium sp. IIBBL 290-4]|uniref:GFA family protein n=1 Tax=Chromobacterium sp. IIBBL 290-4 TaxID=2953890 RepID=UPI0020B86383|nr:GFA family protein [Chromobacterium sp. IIBBL 290-4]UTH75542.1 GFA family protein [Chromobacterium sp. IIBBL 290-4]